MCVSKIKIANMGKLLLCYWQFCLILENHNNRKTVKYIVVILQ